ncbi:chemotaxis response regulator protein-glutamate methylesterase of group 2 operon [Geothrix oryzae]|uniref:Protein-glutamate methylesterase/protein-glutamine glutaminase n=1 Tax=Geothrix oryzae TaxID=2927975 RepID=A0ABM8DNY2_9BACT|nr:chemotaxis response regulator protein-glutamate methylesterase [Geothrix oryzae]BDU68677.1 chemotaxis response regulator protein-glutamate methylesterase of group 2 operon [Geothrix oryzae]
MTATIRILVVDDSPFMRKSLQKMLEEAPDLRVVATARDGVDALEKIQEHQPDIVTLDIEMPRMDGLTCLKKIMADHPMPVLMVSSLTQEGAQATLDALSIGALDFIPKESSFASMSILQIQHDLQEKVRRLATSPRFHRLPGGAPHPAPPAAAPAPVKPAAAPPVRAAVPAGTSLPATPQADLLVLGSSTGGPKALQDILPALPASLPVPCLIVQHMPSTFTKPFADRLDGLCQVHVKEAEQGEPLKAGTVYIAPGGLHMTYGTRTPKGCIELSSEPMSSLHRPSVDVLFMSVAELFHGQALATILTGMGADGAKGMEQLKRKGAHTLAEAEESCVVYGMPRAAVERGCVDLVAPLPDIAGHIRRHFRI